MMKRTMIASSVAMTVLGALPTRAGIEQEPSLIEALIPLAMAAELADNCENTTLKHLDGLSYRAAMQETAISLGYSEADFDEFINDADAFERAREAAEIRLVDLGVDPAGENNHCIFGLNEIIEDTPLGRLIFMW